MKHLPELAEEICYGIPSHYHVELKNRLAIAWGDRKHNQFNGKPRSRAEDLLASRENCARIFYLRAQDADCLLFLPFILAYSPRAYVDFKITNFAEFRKYEWDKIQAEAGTEIKQLIKSMAFRNGFNQNLHYLRFMGAIFPEESQEPEPIVAQVDATAVELYN